MNLTVNQKEHMLELKYRPGSVEECILPARDKEIFKGIVAKGKIPHLVLQSNSPGTGKTTIALAVCSDVNANMMFVNGADCKIDFVRGPMTQFATSMSIDGRPKVIVIDEFDRKGLAESQRHLRTFMEAYGSNCSIIITCNDLNGIIEPLRSRARVVKFATASETESKQMMVEMIKRLMAICESEKITVDDPKVIAALVKKNFPDFRKTVNTLDFYASNGKVDAGILDVVMKNTSSVSNTIELIKTRDLKELRTAAIRHANEYEIFIEALEREIYPQLSPVGKIKMYEIIGENNQMFGLAANAEIHVMYMFTRLVLELKGEFV